VATVGEHLQLFPLKHTFQTSTSVTAFSVPFDYPSKVVWSPGTFEVEVTLIISGFLLTPHSTIYSVYVTVAKWDGAAYDYSGNQGLVLSVDALYGPNCPFSNTGGVNVVNLYSSQPTVLTIINWFLLFHKVQQPNTDPYVTTGFGVVRDTTRATTMSTFTDDITSSSYNVNGVDPQAVRVYGMEVMTFKVSTSQTPNPNTLKVSTTDGINAETVKATTYASGSSTVFGFFGNYKFPTPVTPLCPEGCTCT
jgi:hypothetical protein